MDHSDTDCCTAIRDAAETYTRPAGARATLIGESEPMKLLRRSIVRFARMPAPVLITGETGSGKDLVARAVHHASSCSRGPFVAVNAAAIPSTLAASELFGHERGAFTGAERRHVGAFEQADGGSLFLDELGDVPLDLQAWLLRTLETGEVRSLGAKSARRVDVRVIAATHVDLERAIRSGRFRADLYYRLSVLPLRVPALRERMEDLPAIAQHLLTTFGLPDEYELSPAAIQMLMLHDWPGNVRELRAVLLRAIAFAYRTVLDAPQIALALELRTRRMGRPSDLDRTAVAEALRQYRGNIAAAARELGVPRTTLRDHVRAPGRRRRPPQ